MKNLKRVVLVMMVAMFTMTSCNKEVSNCNCKEVIYLMSYDINTSEKEFMTKGLCNEKEVSIKTKDNVLVGELICDSLICDSNKR